MTLDNACQNKYVINCAARSGSTMLVHMLRSNPSIMSHGEINKNNAASIISGDYDILQRSSDAEESVFDCLKSKPDVLLYKYLFNSHGKRTAGFKLKTDELFSTPFRSLTDLIEKDKSIKILHLYREDLIAQYVSHQVVLHQTKVTNISTINDIPTIKKFEANESHFINYIFDLYSREQASLDLYSAHTGYFISYDDLVKNRMSLLYQLQDFIGVEPTSLRILTEKIITQNLGDLVTNYDAILDIYSNVIPKRPIKDFINTE